MMNKTIDTHRQPLSSAERSERIALALLLVFGAILMLVASRAAAEDRMPFSAGRTDRFNAALASRATVRIENISGDIVARPGKDFSAVATLSVAAATQKRADELLARTVVAQTQDEEGYSLETRWPDSASRDDGGRRRTPGRPSDGRITVKFEVTIPTGMTAVLKTVNGEVRVTDVDGDLDVSSVNGDVRVQGTRHSFRARTVNGRVEAAAALLPAGASVDCRTVNGAVTLTLPKDAKFDFSASAMSGAIASTFPLPVRTAPESLPAKELSREKDRDRTRRIVVHDEDGEDVVVDLREVQREIEQSMREVEIAVRRGLRESAREAQIFTLMPGREYTGSVGHGGASVHASTLSGSITVLAAGTREADASPLVPPRRSFTYPRMRVVQIPEPPEPPVAVPRPPRVPPRLVTIVRPRFAKLLPGEEEDIRRGDITGDFLSTTAGSGYRIGHVSGSVRILTRGGEIHVGSAGLTADLKTYGGDIQIGPVGGDFRALTMAGDVQAGAVAGSATAETSGGDIRIDGVKGALEARTGGGDVIVPSVGGAVDVETDGGDVRLGLTVKQASIAVRNGGGDVILTLPADFRGDFDLQVSGASPEETAIRSEIPGISVTKRAGSQQASGSINGGGPKVVVRTSSGTIRIRKG
ncbi:MAG TPA: DUF4097 family beta strand repeat-containing protein [Thermoanaerobaculia bacterium]|nr:DUF4097 family beta strand repeat-containing protein [Thermoanaerobaculia bacterium]